MDFDKAYSKAPFPYFGGKTKVAGQVWDALGDVKHYIEPCFGSGAVLLNRPDYDPARHIETVNDKDGFISNVWRSLKFSPDKTAEYADWPVNHADLNARRRVLVANESRLLENLINDDEWHDPKMAGYWIWAASCWIGRGLTRLNARPHLSDAGKGVHKLSVRGTGKIPHLGNAGKGVHGLSQRPNIYEWFNLLSERLRYVRVVCGDWERVCGGNWQDEIGNCGIFFDPPYSDAGRDNDIYHRESMTIAQDIAVWSLPRGEKPSYRIVIAGYDGEHPKLEEAGWSKYKWKAHGGYTHVGGIDTQGKKNRHKETLWFSPHCIPIADNVTAKPENKLQLELANHG